LAWQTKIVQKYAFWISNSQFSILHSQLSELIRIFYIIYGWLKLWGLNMKHQIKIRCFIAVFCALFAPLNVFAAPYNGEEMEFTQPDGSTVTVLLFGDEYHIDAESPDGYTLIQGEDGWICYAKLSDDGSEYVSTGIKKTKKGIAPSVQKNIRIKPEAAREKRTKNKKALGVPEDGELYYKPPKRSGKTPTNIPQSAPPDESSIQPAPGDITQMKGIALVIEFPAINGANAITSAATPQHVDSVFNQPKFRATSSSSQGSSVYDWYNDVSNGRMQYKNTVVPYVTADREKAYYDDGCSDNYRMVQYLVHSALKKLKVEVEAGRTTLGQPSTTARNSSNPNTVLALNIYFAGSSGCSWAKGIWPHQGWYNPNSTQSGGEGAVKITEGGVTYSFYWYQMSAMGTSNNIVSSVNTIVHENGHMIMGWPDLYNYDDTVVGVVGSYCVMGSGTAQPNPHFRNNAGWIDVVDITNMNADLSHAANSHTVYKYTRNNKESYLIEARRKTGRSSGIPGEGLIVWQIHTDGQNTSLKTSAPFPLVKVIQANNTNGTEQNFVSGVGASSPFRSGGGSNKTSFSSTTSPRARHYDGSLSNINLSQVSAVGDVMTFRIGIGGTVSSSSTPSSSSVARSSSSSRALSSSSMTRSSSSSVLSSSSSEDITSIYTSQIAISNLVSAVRNGINLQAKSGAVVEVFGLSGNLISKQNFSNGTYSISFGSLPRGVYVVKVSFDASDLSRPVMLHIPVM
jgi:M6 family metalloprotease-like protein